MLRCFPTPTLVKSPLKKYFGPLRPCLSREPVLIPKNHIRDAKVDSNALRKRARVSTLEEAFGEVFPNLPN